MKKEKFQKSHLLQENPVKVMAGPFNGFDGVIEEVYEDKKKLKVVVKIFGRNTPVETQLLPSRKAILTRLIASSEELGSL